MKAIAILINFAISFIGLSLGVIGIAWFLISCAILIRADKKGLMDDLNKKTGIDKL